MTELPTDLGGHSVEEVLDKMYYLQKHCFFMDNVIEPLMTDFAFTEEAMVGLLKCFVQEGWLVTANFMPAYFLRPDKVKLFPVNLSAKGMAKLGKAPVST